MLTAAINDTVSSHSSSGQVVDTKASIGEFDLVMAAMQTMLLPGTSVGLQIQDGSGAEKPSSTGTVSLELPASLLTGELKGDGTLQKPVVSLQGLNLPAGAAVNGAGDDAGQIPSNLSMSAQNDGQMTLVNLEISLPGSVVPLVQPANKSSPGTGTVAAQNLATAPNPAITITGESLSNLSAVVQSENQINLANPGTNLSGNIVPLVQTANESNPKTGTVVAQNCETKLNPAITTITGESLAQLSTAAQNTGQMPVEEIGVSPFIENRVKQGRSPDSEQKNMAVENNNISEPIVKKAFAGDEMVQLTGKESGVNNQNGKAFKPDSPDTVGQLKSGLGTEFGSAIENFPQPNPAAAETVLSNASLAESPKSAALPDLKDRLVQEIKSVLDAGKGEQQRRVQLKLEPEHLGRLTIELFFKRDELSAHFYTGNNYVKEILEGSLQQLRDSLSQQDLRLNEALVFAGDDGRGGDMGRSFEERNGQTWPARNGYYNRHSNDIQVESVNPITAPDNSTRVNYLI